MFSIPETVTAMVINYKTKHLTETCVREFRRFYPETHMLLIDNGSADESSQLVRDLGVSNGFIKAVNNPNNVGHGPAMDQGISMINTEWVFTLDSDAVVLDDTFLQEMLDNVENGRGYAIGWWRWVRWNTGIPLEWTTDPTELEEMNYIPYIHPYAALYRIDTYLEMAPFYHHGAPCLANMLDAKRRGDVLIEFPVRDRVMHWIAGTRRMWDGDWQPKGRPPTTWKAEGHFEI